MLKSEQIWYMLNIQKLNVLHVKLNSNEIIVVALDISLAVSIYIVKFNKSVYLEYIFMTENKRNNFFMIMNLFYLFQSILVMFNFSAVVLTGEIWSFVQFAKKYPYVIYNILGFSLLSALGQVTMFFFSFTLHEIKNILKTCFHTW